MMIKLTNREKTVYGKMIQGFNSREIAELFLLHETYVKKVLARIYRKHNVKSRHQLLAARIEYLEDVLMNNGIDYN